MFFKFRNQEALYSEGLALTDYLQRAGYLLRIIPQYCPALTKHKQELMTDCKERYVKKKKEFRDTVKVSIHLKFRSRKEADTNNSCEFMNTPFSSQYSKYSPGAH